MKLNVNADFCPDSCNLGEVVIEAIEKKVVYKKIYGEYVDNITLATL